MTPFAPTSPAQDHDGSDDAWPDDPAATATQWSLGLCAPTALTVYAVLSIAHSTHLTLATAALGAATALHAHFFARPLHTPKLPTRLATALGAILTLAALTLLFLH